MRRNASISPNPTPVTTPKISGTEHQRSLGLGPGRVHRRRRYRLEDRAVLCGARHGASVFHSAGADGGNRPSYPPAPVET